MPEIVEREAIAVSVFRCFFVFLYILRGTRNDGKVCMGCDAMRLVRNLFFTEGFFFEPLRFDFKNKTKAFVPLGNTLLHCRRNDCNRPV